MASLRRAAVIAAVIEVPLSILLVVCGIPSPLSRQLLPRAVEFAHLPGILLLERIGLCCGYANSLVISDAWSGPVQHPSAVGVVLLSAANLVILGGLVFLALVLHRLLSPPTEGAAA